MNPPEQPTKPAVEAVTDPELIASAATAVEQWRNYQNVHAAYQQQCAAYQQYTHQMQYAQTAEQQQMVFQQYFEQDRKYRSQLEHYEHYKQCQQYQQPYMPPQPMPVPMQNVPHPHIYTEPPPSMINPVAPVYYEQPPRFNETARRPRGKPVEKKSELHTKTTFYLNPEDEDMLPKDLKNLFKELQCDLCRTRMNSHVSANIHYQSKSHDKKITQWLKEWCTETGTPMPVRVRKQPNLTPEAATVGPSVFHCTACDLPLTSVQHANQHYTGKRHQMVVNGKKTPSGAGYYSPDGKWIRSADASVPYAAKQQQVANGTRNKVSPRPAGPVAGSAKRSRLEPPPFPPPELIEPTSTVVRAAVDKVPPSSNAIPTITVDSDDDGKGGGTSAAPAVAAAEPSTTAVTVTGPKQTTLEDEVRKKNGLDCVDANGTFCTVCETSVTSRTEMIMHLKGAKHLKKLRQMGRVPFVTPADRNDTILSSVMKPTMQTDWSLYRMPTGKFYCKSCNLIVADEKLFGQHWYGKKHKLKVRHEMADLASQPSGTGTAGEAASAEPTTDTTNRSKKGFYNSKKVFPHRSRKGKN